MTFLSFVHFNNFLRVYRIILVRVDNNAKQTRIGLEKIKSDK